MALYTVTTGNTVLAADVNQMVNVLQRAASQTETGGYFLTFNAYTSACYGGTWINSLSRVSVPASVSIDTSVQAPAGCNSPSTNNVTANGFHVYAGTSASTINANVGGLYTLQY